MAKKLSFGKITVARAKTNVKESRAAKKKARAREDFSQAAAQIVRAATEAKD